MKKSRSPNHLKDETSSYLKQHQFNPVDWYPWSPEAFTKASREQKPIFLSIGYATCHWCHVMAHESFEDEEVASMLNTDFICIKVDREEHPEIDHLYMQFCQAMTGSGGWPLTIIMTPEKQPFFAATYLPKHNRYGIKGLLTLLPEITALWKQNKEKLITSAQQITQTLNQASPIDEKQISSSILDTAYDQFVDSYDAQHGGFGSKPKFPTPHHLLFLLRYWKKTQKPYSLTMVKTTLQQMRNGGIYDHIGYGFHRYSTDERWRVPHFEKMLYDQALLIMVYTEAYQATHDQLFKQTAQEIITYVNRELKSSFGGFYAGQDADTEGKEGSYYTWTTEELKTLLTSDEMDFIKNYYSIKDQGNITIHPMTITHENLFIQSMNLEDFAETLHLSKEEIITQVENIRKKLYKARSQRIPPEKDEMILTDWNSLLMAALAQAGRILDEPSYISMAEQIYQFIITKLSTSEQQLFHSYQNGQAKIPGFADDYAFFIWSLLELFQTTFQPKYLKQSMEFTHYFLDHFSDKTNGGIFFTDESGDQILMRTKKITDGAYPSAFSVTLSNLIGLFHLTGNVEFADHAENLIISCSTHLSAHPMALSHFLTGLLYYFNPSSEIIIVGNKQDKETKKILKTIRSFYLPHTVVILEDAEYTAPQLNQIIPSLSAYTTIDNRPTIYVCQQFKCQQPTTHIAEMKRLLNELSS